MLTRLVLAFRKSFVRNDREQTVAACTFVAHLVNQRVAHEVLALEILFTLLENPTDDRSALHPLLGAGGLGVCYSLLGCLILLS